jgi:iron complex outermembrane receptor protein/vitamin B12 transporter
MRQSPGVFVVQEGQTGGETSLFVRGGNSTANAVYVDGVPAVDVGGAFDYGTVSSTGIGKLELYRGADSAVYGTDAGAGVVTIETPRGVTLKPVLDYTGDAGNLHEWRNEVTAGGTARKLDYLAGWSRLDASNALPLDRFHDVTSVANLGYAFNGTTDMRLTMRYSVAAQGLPGAHDFYGISNNAKQSDEDLYSGLMVENTYHGEWHNLLRYGVARKREQALQFGDTGTPLTVGSGDSAYTEYFGDVVTIRGANGYAVTGRAAFFQSNEDQDSNRDQLYLQSDWSRSPVFRALFGFRYDDERGSLNDADYDLHESGQRTNFEYTLEAQGEIAGTLTYAVGGAVEKNHIYGLAATPRLGLSVVAIRPGPEPFHGTRLRGNIATGVQEPSLSLEFASLYGELSAAGDTADIVKYGIGPSAAQRSRSYEGGLDQNILGDKLVLRAAYFHNVFDRQLEGVSGQALAEYFGVSVPAIQYAYLNSLAFRAQGAEVELEWQPATSVLVRGGYTRLDGVVLQSFASDAVAANQGTPTENPQLPGIAIGAESPLVGARPFRRPPKTGFLTAQYTRPKYNVALKAAFAGHSDDSTFLDGFDPQGGNSLLLPNSYLDFAYAKVDLRGEYALRSSVKIFAQIDNLLNDQHIGPIGYPALPLTVRAGLKIRLGGD